MPAKKQQYQLSAVTSTPKRHSGIIVIIIIIYKLGPILTECVILFIPYHPLQYANIDSARFKSINSLGR
jgi:hypothetical protein